MPKTNTITGAILESLGYVAQVLPKPFETPYAHVRRIRHIGWAAYRQAVRNLERRGAVSVISKNGQKFLELTKTGQLETLFVKSRLRFPPKWDGKWRLIMFDIPEDCRNKRNQLRNLLRQNNFFKLQASVFINPYPLNAEALLYLQKARLMNYIRILRVDGLDNDKDLRKRFKL